ncbi:Hypothetical protein R9X50_00692300 [Acrodontium crateriforme]|uniref:Uncharacterized protein n=1 Tax=Acrodontium crateriforme TaxID=150365 RepID=A0AAQ3M9C8_9PEZI|nr:Hypothetical protein R9X50_00692300 [Acrodontium crateriforme]
MDSNAVRFLRRDDGASVGAPMIGLIASLLVLLVVAVTLVGTLWILRRRRRRARLHEISIQIGKRPSMSSTSSSPGRSTTRSSEPDHIYYEKQALMEESESIPESPIPEIRVTFPEEIDETGKRMSGKVVTVHSNDTGVGYGPADHPPAYRQQSDNARFQSLDLERIGGLAEKAPNVNWK